MANGKAFDRLEQPLRPFGIAYLPKIAVTEQKEPVSQESDEEGTAVTPVNPE